MLFLVAHECWIVVSFFFTMLWIARNQTLAFTILFAYLGKTPQWNDWMEYQFFYLLLSDFKNTNLFRFFYKKELNWIIIINLRFPNKKFLKLIFDWKYSQAS